MNYGMNMNPYMNMGNYMNQVPAYQMPGRMQNEAIGGDIITVNGREGAETLALRPNSRILLLDNSKPIVWLKQTDGAGYGTVTGYTITPLEENQPQKTNYSSLENRIANIEKHLEEIDEKWKSYSGGTKTTTATK